MYIKRKAYINYQVPFSFFDDIYICYNALEECIHLGIIRDVFVFKRQLVLYQCNIEYLDVFIRINKFEQFHKWCYAYREDFQNDGIMDRYMRLESNDDSDFEDWFCHRQLFKIARKEHPQFYFDRTVKIYNSIVLRKVNGEINPAYLKIYQKFSKLCQNSKYISTVDGIARYHEKIITNLQTLAAQQVLRNYYNVFSLDKLYVSSLLASCQKEIIVDYVEQLISFFSTYSLFIYEPYISKINVSLMLFFKNDFEDAYNLLN